MTYLANSDASTQVPVLMWDSVRFDQELNRTTDNNPLLGWVQITAGIESLPSSTLVLIFDTLAAVTAARTLYLTSSGLVVRIVDPTLGIDWHHVAVDKLSWEVIKRPGKLPWWLLTVTAQEAAS